MSANISGDYNTGSKEVDIVSMLLINAGIIFNSVEKSDSNDDEDIVVKVTDGRIIRTIEVKEESVDRIARYNDLGIDYISVFQFKNRSDVSKWKGSPKHPGLLEEFESSIIVNKPGKIHYSKADIWLFYSLDNDGQIRFADWYIGSDLTSADFNEYLRMNCYFAVNNKPISQKSHDDYHQSAVFFINRNDSYLLSLKKSIEDLF